MRNRLCYCLPVLLAYFLLTMGAAAQTGPPPGMIQKLYLNPKAAGGENQSRFIDSIKFIPLEPNTDARINLYSYVQVTDRYFIIINYSEKSFLLYTKAGNFIKKVSYKKLGENFWPDYQEQNNQIVFWGNNKNYALTQSDRIKIELNRSDPRNRKYFKKYIIDLNDTTFKLKKALPSEYEIINAYHYYDDYYIRSKITTSPLYKDSLDYELKIYRNGSPVKAYFPYNRISEPRYLFTEQYAAALKMDTPYIRYLTRPYCDTIYKLTRDRISPLYQLVLPIENSLPPTFFTKPFKNKTERDNFNRNNGWLLRQIYLVFESKKFMVLTASYLSNYELYVYDKQKSVFYNSKKIKADSSQYNLQLLSEFNTSRLGNKFYKLQKIDELKEFFNKNKTIPVPKELEARLKMAAKDPDPVIIEYQFKN
ncbi:6-bladed beta-propeller [Niabella beijingensis]|uniref:6-bladed beta-propeller n=1 Tax=Niabella beijingensis TaxID=2872700 RepID=UPI001CBC8004|nr:6-bladed beta-propeller [Niabella beijingensis]MBZ4189839.1 6-bladed beta-propeller [Niabella beijingensis]